MMFKGCDKCPSRNKCEDAYYPNATGCNHYDRNEGEFEEYLRFEDTKEAFNLAIKSLKEKPIEAEWLFVSEGYYDVIYVCTKCGRFFTMPKGKDNDVLSLAPYCHCGAKMIKTRYEK